ncbi:MAG: hypothetical protein HOP19_20820 [Acidobacteria bacterium]|nr:hypothetical protein [Acidobacteriota bacterium]
MAKQTKPQSKRTQVKDLRVAPQELTTDEAAKVKGGGTPIEYIKLEMDAVLVTQSRPGTTTTTAPIVKK